MVKIKWVSARVDPEFHAKVREYAAANNVSVEALVISLLKAVLSKAGMLDEK